MATANLTDMSILATDITFGNRVFSSLMLYCSVTLPSEVISSATIQIHQARKNFASAVLSNTSQNNPYKQLFINVVSANQIVANDATTNGTLVGLGSSQIASAAALCTDTDINNAVASAFNSFISGIG